MSSVYRIEDRCGVVGAIVAVSKTAALAYAQGKYGASATVERVAYKETLKAMPVCVIFSTREVHTNDISRGVTIRLVSR
jgi:hypothetical protein